MNEDIESCERIKMNLNDRIAADRADRDSLLARQIMLEERFEIIKDKLHKYEDRLDRIEKRIKKRD